MDFSSPYSCETEKAVLASPFYSSQWDLYLNWGSLAAWEVHWMVPLPLPLPCYVLTIKENPAWRLEGAMAYPIQIPNVGVKDQDRREHCRARFSNCLDLASATKSFGSLNATDFNKVDFKCTYEPRLRDRSVCSLKLQPDLTVMEETLLTIATNCASSSTIVCMSCGVDKGQGTDQCYRGHYWQGKPFLLHKVQARPCNL